MLKHTKEAKRFYKSAAWQKCRLSYINSVFGLCELCKDKPGLIVHHKIEIDSININDPNVTLNHSNLMYVCQTHHNQIHFKKHEAVRDGFGFDSQGNLIQLEE